MNVCYNIALPNTWKSIFKISNVEDVRNRLKKFIKINYQEGHGNTGWTTDQQDLYSYVLK